MHPRPKYWINRSWGSNKLHCLNFVTCRKVSYWFKCIPPYIHFINFSNINFDWKMVCFFFGTFSAKTVCYVAYRTYLLVSPSNLTRFLAENRYCHVTYLDIKCSPRIQKVDSEYGCAFNSDHGGNFQLIGQVTSLIFS